MMNETESILEVCPWTVGEDARSAHVTFQHPDRDRVLVLNHKDWREMGAPQEVTVAVWAGDQMNNPATRAVREGVPECSHAPAFAAK